MNKLKITTVLFPIVLIILFVVFAYSNVVFFRHSLNPVLLIPPEDIKLSTGYADITGTEESTHGWHVDLANPAYLEWPVNIFIGRSLKAGHIPLVMPHQSLGVPLIGQYCHRVLSPYQMIENLFFPRGYDFFILFRLILAGIFTCLFIRPLCRKTVSALCAGIGYGLGSIMVIYSNHEEVANVAMLLPLLIWAVRAFFDRPGLSRCGWLSLALALVHTAGQPEIQLYLLFLALLYGLTRLFTMPARSRKAALLYSLIAILLSAVIAGPQIYLFLRFHQEAWTFHPPGGKLGLQSPMLLGRFLFTFLPKLRQTQWEWSYRTINLLWDWVGGYFSLGLLFLAAAAARRPRRNRREIALFGGYFFFILAKNLGWSPAQMLGLLPFFDQTWSPRWAAATWSFALAVLAGLGLDNLLDKSPAQKPAPKPERSPAPESLTTLLANPLVSSALLFITIILAIVFWWRGRMHWEAKHLREYVFFNGSLFFLLAAGAIMTYFLLSRPVRDYLNDTVQAIRRALVDRQLSMIALLSAVAVAALRWIPLKHYSFSQPEPVTAYLFAAPVILAALFGLFFMAASPSHAGTVICSAIAIPLVFLSGWVSLPTDSPDWFQTIYWVIFSLALASFLIFNNRPRILRIILPIFSFPLLGGLAALVLSATFVSEARFDWLLRLHGYFAIFLLAVFSGLSLRSSRGGAGYAWFFPILVWTELTIYIPKQHSDRYLLIDAVPFLVAAAMVLGCVLRFRRSPLFAKRRKICLLTGIILCGCALILIDGYSSKHLPTACSPEEPLPFVRYLRDKKPAALVGIGRVLSPNFASAHGLADLRGCVSMNTNAYQFFLENILRVVPRNSSYSLWFTGDNPISMRRGSPYVSSRSEHLQAFIGAFPFYILSSTRYILSPPGLLDTIGGENTMAMRKVYAEEADIWEIPALPPAFIAHRAEVISMLSDTRRWETTVVADPGVMNGECVILEEEPPAFLPESEPSASDRAELIPGDDPNRFRVRFYSEQPGYLVINRAYTNLLRAYLDGKEVPLLKANGPFIAIPVSGGHNVRVIELTYLSPPVRASFLLSILGLLIVVGGMVIAKIRKRNK